MHRRGLQTSTKKPYCEKIAQASSYFFAPKLASLGIPLFQELWQTPLGCLKAVPSAKVSTPARGSLAEGSLRGTQHRGQALPVSAVGTHSHGHQEHRSVPITTPAGSASTSTPMKTHIPASSPQWEQPPGGRSPGDSWLNKHRDPDSQPSLGPALGQPWIPQAPATSGHSLQPPGVLGSLGGTSK